MLLSQQHGIEKRDSNKEAVVKKKKKVYIVTGFF
jgi:hypothetical protein